VALTEAAEAAVAQRWLDRIVFRLAEQIDRELRQGLALSVPTSEEQALGIIKGVAADLRAASQALFKAADDLKRVGKGYQASQAHLAAQRANQAAEDLIGA
jgi:hypothetical protein